MEKNVLKVILGSIIVEALMLCFFILRGEFDLSTYRSVETIIIIFGYSVPCFFYARLLDKEKYKGIAIIGTIVAVVTGLIVVLDLLDKIEISNSLEKICGISSTVVGWLAVVSLALSYPSVNSSLSIIKKVVISMDSVVCSFIIINSLELIDDVPMFLIKGFAVALVLTFASVVCMVILARMYKQEIVEEEMAEINFIEEPSLSDQPISVSDQVQNAAPSEPVITNNQQSVQKPVPSTHVSETNVAVSTSNVEKPVVTENSSVQQPAEHPVEPNQSVVIPLPNNDNQASTIETAVQPVETLETPTPIVNQPVSTPEISQPPVQVEQVIPVVDVNNVNNNDTTS